MKIVIMILTLTGILLYIDKKYNDELIRTYEYNVMILQTYCAANGLKRE